MDQLVKEIWPETYLSIIGEDQVRYMLATFQSLKNIQEDIQNGDRYFILYENQTPIGYTDYREEPKSLYISKLYLKQSTRGKGYASQVFQWFETLAAGKTLRLNVNKANTRAIAVYEHRGFKQVAACKNSIGQGYIMDDYVYEKDIHL